MILTCLYTATSTKTRDDLVKQQQWSQVYYNKQSKTLSQLKSNDVVRVKHGNQWEKVNTHTKPCSCIIKTADGRNRRHLRHTNEDITMVNSDYIDDGNDIVNNAETSQNTTYSSPEIMSDQQSNSVPLVTTSETRSRYGRIIRPPLRYHDQVV